MGSVSRSCMAPRMAIGRSCMAMPCYVRGTAVRTGMAVDITENRHQRKTNRAHHKEYFVHFAYTNGLRGSCAAKHPPSGATVKLKDRFLH